MTTVVLGLTVALGWGEPLDRIAVSVGNRVITESTLLLDLRVTAFMNQTALDFSAAAKRAEAERLVDLLLIQKEAADSHLVLAGEDQPALLSTLKSRYASDQQYQSDLARYGISENDLKEHLRAGARTMAFSDLRFRVMTQISEDELRGYYTKLVATQTPSAAPPSFETSRTQIEDLLREQRALDAMDEWLKTARKSVRISYREQVFQ